MSTTTGVSRADALEAAVTELCPRLTPDRRWRAHADDPRLRFSGGHGGPTFACVVNEVPRCDRSRGGKGITVEKVGNEECCHRFSWDEMFAACDGAPRQAGLL